MFDIKPAIIDFGPMLVEHTYRQNLTLLNKGNFIARGTDQAAESASLVSRRRVYSHHIGKRCELGSWLQTGIRCAPCGQKVGKFEHVLEIVTERNMYRIPIKCEVMDSDEHKERLEWVNLNKKEEPKYLL